MQRFTEWIKRNVALVVALDVILSLVLFGVLQYQQTQIDGNSSKVNCYATVFDHALIGHHPRAELTTEARRCARLK